MSRHRRPKVRRPRPWAFPEPHEFTLANGLQVLVYERPGQYVVSAGLCLDVPLGAEPEASEGVATVALDSLDEGTLSHPGTSFGDAVEDAGAVLEGSVGFSSTQVYLDVAVSRLPEALPLLAEVVAEPSHTDVDVERHRTLRLAELDQLLANPTDLAATALRRFLVHPRYRAARPRGGLPHTLASVTPDDVRAFHSRFYGPAGGTLVLAGDLDAGVLDLVESAFGGWRNDRQGFGEHEVPQPTGRAAWLVDRPGAVQADVRLGRFTIDRRDARWATLQIATHALGGAFLSRLNRVLREERGYTYGVSLVNAPLRDGGLSWVQGSFRSDVAADALALLPDLLDVSARPLTDDEVVQARDYLTGVAPLQYATASGVCNAAMSLLAAGLTTHFIDATRDAYQWVDAAAASEVTRELLDPRTMSLVVVGDARTLEPALTEQGWDTTVVTPGDLVRPS